MRVCTSGAALQRRVAAQHFRRIERLGQGRGTGLCYSLGRQPDGQADGQANGTVSQQRSVHRLAVSTRLLWRTRTVTPAVEAPGVLPGAAERRASARSLGFVEAPGVEHGSGDVAGECRSA